MHRITRIPVFANASLIDRICALILLQARAWSRGNMQIACAVAKSSQYLPRFERACRASSSGRETYVLV
jgi:hypothetical protein